MKKTKSPLASMTILSLLTGIFSRLLQTWGVDIDEGAITEITLLIIELCAYLGALIGRYRAKTELKLQV